MSASATLARPYAKAAFELAQKAASLPAWSAKLVTSAALAQNDQIALLLASPRLTPVQRVALLLPQSEPVDSSYAHFLTAMAENMRLQLLPEVLSEYQMHRANAERTLQVRVRSAMPIDPTQQQSLIDKLSKRFQRTVELVITIDSSLIGGAVLDAGEIVIDGSLSGKLNRMQSELAA